MVSRTPQATSQSASRPSWKRVLIWLKNVLLVIFLIILIAMGLVKLETWRRQQKVLSMLGNDPMMSRQLLGMNLIEQEIRINPVLFNWKPTSPELINHFEIKNNQREVFDQLVKLAQENGWKKLHISIQDNYFFFSAYKDNTMLTIFTKTNSGRVSIERS